MTSWQPLFGRLKHEHKGDVLHEGVPDWLWSGLFNWLRERLTDVYNEPASAPLQAIEQALRTPLNWRYGREGAYQDLVEKMAADEELALEVVNYLLASLRTRDQVLPLALMLQNSGSAWTVAKGQQYRLERRVPLEITERFEDTAADTRAGDHLRAAWRAMYGRNPDPSTTYRQAVSAVESAGAPVISPTNTKTTLGTMIRDFRAKPSKWEVPLGSTPNQGREVLLAMMEGVWHGQVDRHGSPTEDRPISVAPAEAEAALHTALTLVHLFQSGLVKRTDDS